jgi:hypothetical protein
MLEFAGVALNLEFVKGRGDVRLLPNCPGIYAQVHWPTRSLRIGESKHVRTHNLAHIRWAEKHRDGTHPPHLANRRGLIVELVKAWGAEGLEHYLISDNPRLADRILRVDCEKFLHEWARTQKVYVNINTQRGYRTVN